MGFAYLALLTVQDAVTVGISVLATAIADMQALRQQQTIALQATLHSAQDHESLYISQDTYSTKNFLFVVLSSTSVQQYKHPRNIGTLYIPVFTYI